MKRWVVRVSGNLRALVGAWMALLVPLAWTQAPAQGVSASAAALRLIEATAAGDHGTLIYPFTDASRSDWHYTPRRRDGLAWKGMSTSQREATTALLRSALNERVHDKVRALMALEITLRELETFGLVRDPENYAIALYGQQGVGGWGWRIEGHHLSLHFSLDADRYVATLPQFFGANPAVVPRDVIGGAPRAARRVPAARLRGRHRPAVARELERRPAQGGNHRHAALWLHIHSVWRDFDADFGRDAAPCQCCMACCRR